MNKSITGELQEQWTILSEVWGTPMAQWKGVAVAAWMEAAIGKENKTDDSSLHIIEINGPN